MCGAAAAACPFELQTEWLPLVPKRVVRNKAVQPLKPAFFLVRCNKAEPFYTPALIYSHRIHSYTLSDFAANLLQTRT